MSTVVARERAGAPRLPPRPALPPSLYAMVAAFLASHAVMAAGKPLSELACPASIPHPGPLLVAVVGGATCAAGAHAVRRAPLGRPSPIVDKARGCVPIAALILFSLLVGSLSASACLRAGRSFVEAVCSEGISQWQLVVISDPTLTERGSWRARAHAKGRGLPGGDVWLTADATFEIGDVLQVTDGFVANEEDDWGRVNRMQGVWGRVLPKGGVNVRGPAGVGRLVRGLRDRARDVIDPYASEERAILAGCVIGDRRAMDAFALDEVFTSCGVSHLIAVSGGHIVIMSQILGMAVDRLRLERSRRLLLLATLSGLYVLLTGAPAPAVRSWIMALVGFGAQLVGRRGDALSAVALVGLCMALVDPGCVGQVGFMLSVVCVGSLCLFSGYVAYAFKMGLGVDGMLMRGPFEGHAARTVDGLCETLGATSVAQLATIPVTVPVFMQVSLVAPLANLLLTLPFSILIGVGLVASCLPLPKIVAGTLLAPCDILAATMMRLLRLVASVPFASIPFDADGGALCCAVGGPALLLLVAWPTPTRPRARAAIGCATGAIVAYVTYWGLFAPARIIVLDIGQGDAILVQDGSSSILVDAGPDDAIRSALARNHVLRLDAVVITHLHEDHYAGIASLPGFVAVDRVFVADGVVASDDAAGYRSSSLAGMRQALERLVGSEGVGELHAGDNLRVGSFVLNVIWPRGPVAGTENAQSLELLASFDDKGRTLTALLTGDGETDETAAAVSEGGVGVVDLLKVGHHGSAVSISDGLASTLAPLVAIASAGEGNRYGHPTDECIETLEAVGATFLCTKDVGDVCVMPGLEGPAVTCQHAS